MRRFDDREPEESCVTTDPGAWQFEDLFDRYRLDIASYCRWRAASRTDAEDALAEVFLVAWRRLSDIPAGDAARAWLYATARRVLANQRRSTQRRDALHERIVRESDLTSSQREVTNVEEVIVHAAFAQLADDDREVLLLVEWEGLDTAELAQVLGCAPVTARGRVFRARRRFRDHYRSLQEQSDTASDHPTAFTSRESHA